MRSNLQPAQSIALSGDRGLKRGRKGVLHLETPVKAGRKRVLEVKGQVSHKPMSLGQGARRVEVSGGSEPGKLLPPVLVL